MTSLLDDQAVVERVFGHIDNGTTDLGDEVWREPVAHYTAPERLAQELAQVFRRTPTPFCPSAALPEPGTWTARSAAGVPLLAVRGRDGTVRVFLNACRHRGAQVACGSGKGAAFACPYHGWTYTLDGTLAAVPHEDGFPGLDKATHGLVPVRAEERAGLVWVTLDPDSEVLSEAEALEGVIAPDLKLISTSAQVINANWKIFAEGFMEGYHILPTHRTTFYPAQFDNLNVVQAFGRSSRVTFPYRNVEKLRGKTEPGLSALGVLSHVYCVFPNVILATFPKRLVMVVLDPIDIATTLSTTYVLAAPGVVEDDADGLAQATDFVNRGAAEDRAMVESIQAGVATGANDAFLFGRFEAAIVHFHKTLQGML